MKVLAIIPARGGSKGVPKKNIRKLGNFPLIYYSINVAKSSNMISSLFVNTDCNEIEEISKKYECDVIKRSSNLGNDDAKIIDVLLESLEIAEKKTNIIYDILVLLQPTSPFRLANDIDNSINILLNNNQVDGVVSVIHGEDLHPSRLYKLNSENILESLDPSNEQVQRQSLPPVYYRNGCIYAVRSKVLKGQKTLMPKNKYAYIMPNDLYVNIDTERDFLIAEAYLKLFNFHAQ
jgi:CMP-N-acetylneuraminic acid synthetase